MKVYLLVRSKPHPYAANENAPQLGDVVSIRPLSRTNIHKHFTIVKVDLDIPCGESQFKQDGWNCKECQYNHPEDCEFQRFKQPEWDTSDILKGPQLLKKRRYQARYTPPQNIKRLIDKAGDKTDAEAAKILEWAAANEQAKMIIHDKAAV